MDKGKRGLGLSIKKAPKNRSFFVLCPGLDSNQHAVASTTTSRWLVYQFQHLGNRGKKQQMQPLFFPIGWQM